MNAIAFDAHAYVKRLKGVGVSEEQAEVQAQAIAELVNDRLVTKQDLEHAKQDLEQKLERTRQDLEQKLKELEYRLIIRLGGMMVIAISVVATLVKLL